MTLQIVFSFQKVSNHQSEIKRPTLYNLSSLRKNIKHFLLMEKEQSNQQKEKVNAKYTVSVRIRPRIDPQEQIVFTPSQDTKIKELRSKSIITYSFDNVFDDSHDNEFIYQNSIRYKVEGFLKNKTNTTILAYGQTGSGKTHTLFGHKKGKNQQFEELGLAQNVAAQVMGHYHSMSKQAQVKQKGVKCNFLQIYKQKVTDLLNGNSILLRDNSKGELTLENHEVRSVGSKEELIGLLLEANSNKIFGSSYVHSESSRSHVMFTIEFQGAKLNIVDLCGSEVLTYKFDQKQRQETNSINLSLFTLNAVVNDLCEPNSSGRFIPFRNSVLTRLLKSSLVDTKRTEVYLFCNISPQEQHQEYSASTLRFGQLAIEVDEKNNPTQEVVNLSQQKREMKKVSNIIEVAAKQNSYYLDLPSEWQKENIQIFNRKVKVYKMLRQNAKINILLLHAYGGDCDGTDFDSFLGFLSQELRINFYSVDFPGFGKSQGQKFTSRAQKFHEKQQPLQFMEQLFKSFGFSSKNKTFVLGYDLGGAIALKMATLGKFSRSLSGVIAFHPTWTDKIETLAMIQIPVLLEWMPVETFHLVSAGQKMSKVIKNCLLYKFSIGPYTGQKAAGYYDRYTKELTDAMVEFINNNVQAAQNGDKTSKRGKVVEEIVELKVDEAQEALIRAQEAISICYQMFEKGTDKEVFQCLTKGGANKPKFIQLVSDLPEMSPDTLSWKFIQKFKIWDVEQIQEINQVLFQIQSTPFLKDGRQIHVKCDKVHMSVKDGPGRYLSYNQEKGEPGLTHNAWIIAEKTHESQIKQSGKIKVKMTSFKCPEKTEIVAVNLSDVITLNSGTNFKRTALGHYLFEDNVTCNYDSKVTKLIVLKCCWLLKPLVNKYFEVVKALQDISGKQCCNLQIQSLQEQLEAIQKAAAAKVHSVMNLRHLVHEGIDNSRYTGTDVGRLAYYGQGNCHHLASTLCALLLPFGRLLGWDVIFRAGSFFMQGRELDKQGQPLNDWSGKPNVNVEDHTWVEIVYRPSQHIFFMDPSFGVCNEKLENVYSLKGKMHISAKPLNFAKTPEFPKSLF